MSASVNLCVGRKYMRLDMRRTETTPLDPSYNRG
jgi:hypothetical protein